jgi:entericidin A
MEAMMRKIAMILMALSAVLLVGCNTMQGFGKDMEKAGSAIQRKAEK